jgi:hypothetical protein
VLSGGKGKQGSREKRLELGTEVCKMEATCITARQAALTGWSRDGRCSDTSQGTPAAVGALLNVCG